MFPWYAIRVRSNSEFLANHHLANLGYETFLPTYQSVRRWSDRVKTLDRPLFPGYNFCRFDFQNRLPILKATGVVEIVTAGKLPTPIPDTEIEALKLIVASKLGVEPWPFLKLGKKVEITHGPLKGVEGILLAIKKGLRVVVSIDLLQRSVAVEVEGHWLQPLSSHDFPLPQTAPR